MTVPEEVKLQLLVIGRMEHVQVQEVKIMNSFPGNYITEERLQQLHVCLGVCGVIGMFVFTFSTNTESNDL